MTTTREGCHYCGITDELRPYGPGGTPICFNCMKASPEREAAAGSAFMAVLDANAAVSPVGVAAITDDGVIPFDAVSLERQTDQ